MKAIVLKKKCAISLLVMRKNLYLWEISPRCMLESLGNSFLVCWNSEASHWNCYRTHKWISAGILVHLFRLSFGYSSDTLNILDEWRYSNDVRYDNTWKSDSGAPYWYQLNGAHCIFVYNNNKWGQALNVIFPFDLRFFAKLILVNSKLINGTCLVLAWKDIAFLARNNRPMQQYISQ